MKKSAKILHALKEQVHSKAFQKRHIISEKDFTRNCLITISVCIYLILNMIRKSTAAEINDFCELCTMKSFDKSAFTKARAKLSPGAFVELNDNLVNLYYRDRNIKKFCGMVILAVDGYKLQLHDSEEIMDYYGCMKNQSQSNMPGAQCSELYDVMNEIVLCAAIEPCTTSERDIAITLIEKFKTLTKNLKIKPLFIFDRGYPSILFILYLIESGIQFVIRSTNNFLKEISDAVKSNKRDQIIEIALKNKKPKDKNELLKHFPDYKKMKIKLRVLLIKLETGETEILLTNLYDKNKFRYKKFKKLYFLRWCIEEAIKINKVRVEMENMSGKRVITCEQDFFSTILYINITALLVLEARNELLFDPSIMNRKYEYDINYNIALGLVSNSFIFSLMNPVKSMWEYAEKAKGCMKKHLEPVRPNRKYKRRCKHPGRKFHMNQRRAI